MTINCIIVDDEPLARNLLSAYVKKIPSLNLLQTFSSPLPAMEILQNQSVDLMFLDIQMPELTGISFLKILKKRPLVVLTTAYSEYALESYELDVIDYLLKPITLERFLKAVEKVSQRIALEKENPSGFSNENQQSESIPAPHSPPQPFVFVKDGTKLVKIRWKDILYIEGMKDYVAIHTRQQKIVSLQRLKTLESQLPSDQFIRIHHSYIVSLEGLDVIYKDKVQIGKVYIPVSDTYKKQFKEFIDKNHIQPE